MNPKIEGILFDLGGVLVDWDGIQPLRALTGGRLTEEQARRFWLESPSVRLFETGGCSADAFADGVVEELELDISPPEFLVLFDAWDRGPAPAAERLLDELQGDYALYCLSNNNPLHWSHAELQSLLQYFIRSFVSFETGLMKPDLAAFRHVREQLPLSPERILFLDDNPECVSGASVAGFTSRQAKEIEGVKTILRELGLWGP